MTARAELCPTYLRWMIRRDMAEVLRIETESFQCAWTEDDFVRALRQRNIIGRVAEHDDRVAGYSIYALYPDRLELLDFAVAPKLRRQGVGRHMIGELQRKLTTQRRRRILLDIREHNDGGIAFFRALGFRALCLVRNRYGEWSDEDAIRMEYRA